MGGIHFAIQCYLDRDFVCVCMYVVFVCVILIVWIRVFCVFGYYMCVCVCKCVHLWLCVFMWLNMCFSTALYIYVFLCYWVFFVTMWVYVFYGYCVFMFVWVCAWNQNKVKILGMVSKDKELTVALRYITWRENDKKKYMESQGKFFISCLRGGWDARLTWKQMTQWKICSFLCV